MWGKLAAISGLLVVALLAAPLVVRAQPLPIQMTITPDKTIIHPGDTVVYTVTMHNPTNDLLGSMFAKFLIQDPVVPASLSIVSTSWINFTRGEDTRTSPPAPFIMWSGVGFTPGMTWTFTVNVAVPASYPVGAPFKAGVWLWSNNINGIDLVNTTIVSAAVTPTPTPQATSTPTPSPTPRPTSTPSTTPSASPTPSPTPTPTQNPGLTVTKTDNRTTVNPGQKLTYIITVQNTGNVDINDLEIKDTVPSAVGVVTINNGGTRNGSTITWSGLHLDPNESVTVSFNAKVSVNAQDNQVLTNRVTAKSDDRGVSGSATDTTIVKRPQVAAAIAPVPVTARTGAGLVGLATSLILGGAATAFGTRRYW